MRVLLVSLALLGAAPVAAAEGTPPPSHVGRFELAPSDTGFLRLDTRTGATMHCAESGGIWACDPLAIDTALTERVDALAAEVARLTRTLAALTPAAADTGARIETLAAEVEALTARVAALAEAPPPSPVVAVAGEPAAADTPSDAAPAGILAEVVDRLLTFVAALKHG